MLCYPLLRWTVRRSKGLPFDPVIDTMVIAHQLIVLTIWGVICYFLVSKDYLGRDLLLPAIATLACVMAAFYTLQLLIARTENGYHYAMWIKLIGPIGSICMNLWKTQAKDQNLYHIFLMINYDAIFFSQGVIDACYWRKMVRKRSELADTLLAPFSVGIVILLYSVCSPMNYSNFGQLFFYPLYSDYLS